MYYTTIIDERDANFLTFDYLSVGEPFWWQGALYIAIECPTDEAHFNAMRLNENGDLVCSFKNLNSIICLDRKKKDDQIKWFLSGKNDPVDKHKQV